MLSIYLHIPFCRSKCAYCDFFSVPVAEHDLAAYADLLRRQLLGYRHDPRWTGPAATVFFGGGTPSLLPPVAVARLLDTIAEVYGLTAEAEVSLEANPESVTASSLAGYRRAGVNRLSFGVQTLAADALQLLGRAHDARRAARAVRQAADAGFTNIGADLMFALPGQPATVLAETVEGLLAWPLSHLSCYGLTLEPGTPLHQRWRRGQVAETEEDEFAAQFLWLHQRLEAAGWRHYEISNYARPGSECRHNLGYWQRQPCLGLGAGAHSFTARGWGERWAAPDDLVHFAAAVVAGRDPQRRLERFDAGGALAEACYLALRTADGIGEEAIRRRFGRSLAEAFPASAARLGPALQQQGGRWFFRPQDWLLYNHHVQEFLAPAPPPEPTGAA